MKTPLDATHIGLDTTFRSQIGQHNIVATFQWPKQNNATESNQRNQK